MEIIRNISVMFQEQKVLIAITGHTKILNYRTFSCSEPSIRQLEEFIISFLSCPDFFIPKYGLIEILQSAIPQILMCPYSYSIEIDIVPEPSASDLLSPIKQLNELKVSLLLNQI